MDDIDGCVVGVIDRRHLGQCHPSYCSSSFVFVLLLFREYQFEMRVIQSRRIGSLNTDKCSLTLEVWCLGSTDRENVRVNQFYIERIEILNYISDGVAFSRLLNDVLCLIGDCRLDIIHHRLSITSPLQAAVPMVSCSR